MLILSTPVLKKNYNSINQDTAHLSLGYATQRFGMLAQSIGMKVNMISNPDIYRSTVAMNFLRYSEEAIGQIKNNIFKMQNVRKVSDKSQKVIHLSVAPWDSMRLLIPADKNIAHLSWEQTSFAGSIFGEEFGVNMINTLKTFDQVWGCADFVTDGLKKNGICNAITFPTPICSAVPRTGEIRKLEPELYKVSEQVFSPFLFQGPGSGIHNSFDSLAEDGYYRLMEILRKKRDKKNKQIALFVTQGNPGDTRKGLFNLMLGFSMFSASYGKNAFLIVKTPPRSRLMILNELGAHANDFIRWGWWGSKNIIFVPSNLSDDAQKELYGLADYYICSPIAEGQNVPLQEAIQCGCYPISPVHTAMAEYLTPELICCIPSERKLMDPIKYCDPPLVKYFGYHIEPLAIAEACQNALNTAFDQRKARVKELQQKFLYRYTADTLTKQMIDETHCE